MGFTKAVTTCLSKYATLGGRAARPEYWWFFLFVVLGSVVASFIDSAIFGTGEEASKPVGALFSLAMFIPMLAAGWRRLHDTGRPGWWLLVPMLVSLVSVISMLMGVVAFGSIEAAGADAESLRGPAALSGLGGLMVMALIQLALAVLMLYWLTRPTEPQSNAYGAPANG